MDSPEFPFGAGHHGRDVSSRQARFCRLRQSRSFLEKRTKKLLRVCRRNLIVSRLRVKCEMLTKGFPPGIHASAAPRQHRRYMSEAERFLSFLFLGELGVPTSCLQPATLSVLDGAHISATMAGGGLTNAVRNRSDFSWCFCSKRKFLYQLSLSLTVGKNPSPSWGYGSRTSAE